jgi:hypothetical protein
MTVDPILKAIADHAASHATLNSELEVHTQLEKVLPKERRQTNISSWEIKIVETDDPRWIESEKKAYALFDAEEAAALALINVEPTTLAGAASLLRHVTGLEAKGHTWPDGLQEDDDAGATKIGKDWEVYLHRNVAALLAGLLAGTAQAA